MNVNTMSKIISNMKRFILSMLMAVTLVAAKAENTANEVANPGINFSHQSWKEVVEKAKAENKLIFIDFYTQWCGPCLNMAQNVFTLPAIGAYYNSHFVCAKIDAENGEGVTLAKKYGIFSYPTYIFVDPTTEEAVHRSSSRQSPEQFLLTGESALNPQKRSFYLDEKYKQGNRERQLLEDYIMYKNSVYARNDVNKAFDELIQSGAKLSDKDVWPIFCTCISGMTPYLKEVSAHYDTFCQAFGKKTVDEKLAKETTYGNLKEIESLCSFAGKDFNCEMIRINEAIQNKQYDNAISRIDAMIANPAVDQQKLISRLKFIARLSYYRSEDIPQKWFNKCVEYLRYIAYNQTDRDDAFIHQEYAVALEKMLAQVAKDGGKVPSFIISEPTQGKKEYSMRPAALKQKPRRK